MPADKYSSLAALKQQEERSAWCTRLSDRHAPVTVFSPHGGYIEAGSSAIAKAIAGRSHNFFDFQGLRENNASELHVTATNFRDPQLCRMLRRSQAAVSIHGMGNQFHKQIWLGGLNAQLKEVVLQNLRGSGFAVNPDSPLYRGESPRNVVNLACYRGVQLELSDELLCDLFVGKRFLPGRRRPPTTERFEALVRAVRLAIRAYLDSSPCGPCESIDEQCA